jgi:hypothetical protein
MPAFRVEVFVLVEVICLRGRQVAGEEHAVQVVAYALERDRAGVTWRLAGVVVGRRAAAAGARRLSRS